MANTFALPQKPLRVGVVQNSAGSDMERNLRRIAQLIANLPRCDLIALPEVFALRGSDGEYRAAARSMDGPAMDFVRRTAVARRSWILGGSVLERASQGVFNTCALVDPAGKLTAKYRKIHLFEAHLGHKRVVRESDLYRAGDKPVMADVMGWRCGLAICYDLRFPELFRLYSSRGAHVFFLPANFTQRTGRDHWETLLRARAIENQVFVVAPGQCGANPATGIASYGRSMVVGPWGEVIRRAGGSETAFSVVLSPRDLAETRRRIPVLRHRRLD